MSSEKGFGMGRADTYQLLVDSIAAEMVKLSQYEARQLAFDITSLINSAMINEVPSSKESGRAERLMPAAVRNVSSLTAGWDAYRVTHEPGTVSIQDLSQTRVVCTLPSSLRNQQSIRKLGTESGIWAGSLMKSIYDLINRAERELVIVAPYWSIHGVDSLLRHVTRDSMSGVQITLMTPPRCKLDSSDIDGVIKMRDTLISKKATVRIYSPKIEDGRVALLHAKTVVMDESEAYLGSANYSASGVEQGFELGVRLHGAGARGIKMWAETLCEHFEKWE